MGGRAGGGDTLRVRPPKQSLGGEGGVVVVGIPWGLDCQNSHLVGEGGSGGGDTMGIRLPKQSLGGGRGGSGGGDTLGIRLPKQSKPSEIWQSTLAQGRDLGFFSEKIMKKLCLNFKAHPAEFGHKIVSHG